MHSETFFGVARDVGYDVTTRSGQRRRVRHGRTDLPTLLAEFTRKEPCQLSRWGYLPDGARRWDAGFHAEVEGLGDASENESIIVADVANLIDERQDPRRRKANTFNYVEIGDIDGRTGLVGHQRLIAGEAPSRARKIIRAGDVLVSTVRPERGTVGVVPQHLDGAICSTGFAVLRCEAIHPTALAWLLKSEIVKRQMVRQNIGISYPTIEESTCLSLLLPVTKLQLKDITEAAVNLDQTQEAFETARLHMVQLTESNSI